jgi:hypothetical protein
MSEFTRRSLLQRGGAVAGAAAVAPLVVAAPALGGTGLSAERQRTYVALVAAAGSAPDSKVATGWADEAAREFAAWYATQPDDIRHSVDTTLDGLEAAPGKRAFSSLDRRSRYRVLRSLAGADARNPDTSHLSAADCRRRNLAANAVGIAHFAF